MMSSSKCAGIYSITSKINGKRYIGSSVRICERWRNHLRELSLNAHHSKHLQNHYNKYGKDDLIFAVVEVVERDNLSLKSFKDLLLNREQIYLDSWEECQFNNYKTAGSRLGYKDKKSKYYTYDKKQNKYKVSYVLWGTTYYVGAFNLEIEAQERANFIKSLNEKEFLLYWENNFKEVRAKNCNTRNYFYVKNRNMFVVYFRLQEKELRFGQFKTEEEAKIKVEFLKDLSDDDKLLFHINNCRDKSAVRIGKKTGKAKGYYYSNYYKDWKVEFKIEGTKKSFGSFKTEEEADKLASYLKELSDSDKLIYHENNIKYKKPIVSKRVVKGYYFSNYHKTWNVEMYIDGKRKCFGNFKSEEKAKEKVDQIKKEFDLL